MFTNYHSKNIAICRIISLNDSFKLEKFLEIDNNMQGFNNLSVHL